MKIQKTSQVNLDLYLRNYNDQRSVRIKIGHTFIAILNEFKFLCSMVIPLIQNSRVKWRKHEYAPVINKAGVLSYDLEKLSFRRDATPSEGLCVLIQGLGGYPFIWKKYIDDLKQLNPKIHCVAPVIYKRGNDRLKKVSQPVLAIIKDYIAKNPNKPICFVGISNGARIASYLERKLYQESCPIKNYSIAGVHFGTNVMNMAIKTGLVKIFRIHPEVQKDMKFASGANIRRLHAWRKRSMQAQGKRERVFYASTEDLRVDLRSSIPKIDHKTDAQEIFNKHSHISMLNAPQKAIVNSVNEWVKNNQPI